MRARNVHGERPAHGGTPAGLRLGDVVGHAVGEVVDRRPEGAVLVGNGWGGHPVAGAAHTPAVRVRRVVYRNAVVPERGISTAAQGEAYDAVMRECVAASPDGTVPLPFGTVRYGLAWDGPAEPRQFSGGRSSRRAWVSRRSR
ncbi:hypothetical protein [Streptomyces sp. NPDC056160]|uniref:hypothetical protein n=1 Tax=Streptomyces sp. NPDC056160 TaxID=3345731 RepID=UPI0035E0D9D8